MKGDSTEGERGRQKEDGARKDASIGKEKEKRKGKGSGANEVGADALPAHASVARSAGGGDGGEAAGDCAAFLGEALALASFNLSALPPPPSAEAGETGTGGGAAAAGRGAGLVPGAAGQGRALRRFTYDALSAWTENFSKRLGTGGLGSVFYGSLVSGRRIAVKKLVDAGAAENDYYLVAASEDIRGFTIKRCLVASGLKWTMVGATKLTQGRELSNSELATALKSKSQFRQQEWEALGISDLGPDDFIKVDGFYFRPSDVVGYQLPHPEEDLATMAPLLARVVDLVSVVDPW